MNYQKKCPNMNHGRMKSGVKFCPSCGEKLDANSQTKCDPEKHAARRKDRDQYCIDCGLLLAK